MTDRKLTWSECCQPMFISSVGAAVFGVTAFAVAGEPGPIGFDVDALTSSAGARTGMSTLFMLNVSRIGRGMVTAIVVTSLVFWLIAHRDRASAIFLAVANLGSLALSNSTKAMFARPRPDIIERITDPQSLSFPSGHALSAMVFYTSVAMVAYWRLPAWRTHVTALAAFMIATMGVSRVYLGVHYPTDVLGGYGLGAAWVWFVYLFYKRAMLANTPALLAHANADRA